MILMQMVLRIDSGTDRFHLMGLNFKNDFVIERGSLQRRFLQT
jgi:hypothetical protein